MKVEQVVQNNEKMDRLRGFERINRWFKKMMRRLRGVG